ncbi:hypothetical protein DKX38_025668 [Salix brachista]|uniref:Malectin domain-containing protein n=1 Tax=Salix brachista TaxID=2182728 RepID=A0A5N5JQ62_9ROSI|nr:hypothetical protein DKX38_025668 [Salix brachista]
MSFSRLLFASLIAFGLATYAFGAAVLPADEVKALRDIAKTLGKTDWNFSADPCGGQWGWANPHAVEGIKALRDIAKTLGKTDWNFSADPCGGQWGWANPHAVEGNEKASSEDPESSRQSSTGFQQVPLPPSNEIDLPVQSPKKLETSALLYFTVEFNQFSGVLTPEPGNLSRLEKLGNAATIEGNLYEDDTDPDGSSRFYQRSNWAVSTTGHFMDDDRNPDSYIWTNATKLSANTSSLYMDARLSPGKLVQKNFSIQDEAGGIGKAIIKNFTAIVTGGALEIRFYWVGKGTTGLPVRGVYGPLISAISVTPDFKPPSEKSSSTGTSDGIVVGIVAAAVVLSS